MPRCSGSSVRTAFLAVVLAFMAACGGGSGLSGTYEASDGDGGMTLEFEGEGQVTLTFRDPDGTTETQAAQYLVDGNNITVQVEGGMPLVLVRDGDVLQANMLGQILRFEKK